ncbi:hypothetical protein HAX54_021222, partial [Datura stramonium]|nr:hypothetical protein [Datura stramonium]
TDKENQLPSDDDEESDNEESQEKESSDQEDYSNEQTGEDLTTKEESSADDYESIEGENTDSDVKAENLIQTFNNTRSNKEVEQAFHELTEKINLSPRGKHNGVGKASKSKRGGNTSQPT